MEEQYYTIILRHDTSTKWLVNDPVLYLGEYGVEDDTHKVKRGDGESKWSELPYEDFGLQYIVTFENLHGKLADNEILVNEFDKKIDKSVFDDVSSSVVTSIIIVDENTDEGNLMDITRTTKNILSGASTRDTLLIKSSDKTVQAFWSINDQGNRVLNLRSASSICDYEPERKYYKDQLCYKGNKLYRAYEDITADTTFNPNQWVLLASLHSNDIKYDNLISGLDSENVKDALDELKRRDDRKVQKSTEERIVYGTDLYGQQTVIPIDDLRKVDTVNHKQADLNKNVQIDAGDINYSDINPAIGTVRQILDSKVDKTFAGHGTKIVRDVQFEYNEATGHIILREDKVSPEDGSSATEEREIDVVSEQELANEVSTLNTRIDSEVQTLNDRVDTEVNTLNERIDDEVETLNTTITTKETAIYNKIQEEHDEINTRVDNEVQTLNDRIDTEVSTLNTRIDNEVDTLNNTINTKEQALQEQIDTNASEIERVETESQTRDTELDDRITQEVETLNTTIDTKEQTINTRIDNEVDTLNDRIDSEVSDLNDRIDEEVATLNDTIDTKETAMDNKKIDKDLSTLLVTDVIAASQSQEPTMKIIQKNTTTKESIIHHLHFKAGGRILTKFVDEDHILIDSTPIDEIDNDQNRRLGIVEGRLDTHDTNIAALQEHDLNHDRLLATHSAQIADHETRIAQAEDDIIDLNTGLDNEITNRTTADTNLSTRIADNAVRIANNTQAIRDNADSIDQLAQTLEENVEALTNSKANKDFATDSDDKVVGKLESDTITGSELFNLKETMVSPVDGTSSIERIKIISSDGTVVATRNNDGTIDLATNLDTDVNYFVTTEIISTTIAAETTLDMTKLTPTDKQEVELQDIISDPEGTWGRVKAIDTANNECTVVTFKKHAQAVWGTIKGTLADQTDLQTILSGLASDISDEASTRSSADTLLQTNITNETSARQQADTTLQGNIDTEVSARQQADTNLDTNKVDKVSGIDKIYGTDNTGAQTSYDKSIFGVVDTINNVGVDTNTKNITIDGSNINVDETAATKTTIKAKLEALSDDKLDKSNGIDKIYGTDNNGNQTTFNKSDFGVVDTVNNVQIDNNKNIQLDASNINLDDTAATPENLQTIINNMMTDLQTQIQTYTQDTSYTATGTYVSQKFVTFTRADGVMLMAKVLKNFTADTTKATAYESFLYDIDELNLKLVGIPEQAGGNPVEEDAEEALNILNEVDGVQDTYDGMGGTEAEINQIFDEILGE